MPTRLDELREMDTVQARALSFDERNELLDQILASARRYVGKQPERQVGLMCDYIEEDLDLLCKVGAVRIVAGGFIPVDQTGEVPSADPKVQYGLIFENIKNGLAAAGSNLDRITSLVICLRSMTPEAWADMNAVYREYIECCPARAAIGVAALNKTYQIEVINLVAWKVAP
jgi:enamine deaminase RidA (YjgF/YER057c/UK114 family)